MKNGSYKVQTIGFRPTCTCDVDTGKAIILDPFMGAGTTALVALELGRDFIGIEISEEYIKIANQRLNGAKVGLGI